MFTGSGADNQDAHGCRVTPPEQEPLAAVPAVVTRAVDLCARSRPPHAASHVHVVRVLHRSGVYFSTCGTDRVAAWFSGSARELR
ncbi:hypothetical protein GCM10025762_46030 [Haloechinothrix salitolerans]